MVVAAHPDDETFGCGGTLAQHVLNGHPASIVVLTCSEKARKGELVKASKILGIKDSIVFEEDELAFQGETVHRLAEIFILKKPEIVVTHLPWDYHREHRASYEIVKDAIEWAAHTTAYENAWRVSRLLLMEINTMIPTPHVLVDISEVFDRKLKAMDCYPSQLAKFPEGYYQSFNRAKAELRGAQGRCLHAEAFLEDPLARNSPFFRIRSTRSLFD